MDKSLRDDFEDGLNLIYVVCEWVIPGISQGIPSGSSLMNPSVFATEVPSELFPGIFSDFFFQFFVEFLQGFLQALFQSFL